MNQVQKKITDSRGQSRQHTQRIALCIAIVGMQSGDEGKGRIVDMLAVEADMVIRFQGGDNAGHTVMNEFGKFALHMIPSGVFNAGTICIVGAGCVANPTNLWKEIQELESKGVNCDKVFIDERCHVVMPWHIDVDEAQEKSGKDVIGTTKRGIGPAYATKFGRKFAFRWCDLMKMVDLQNWCDTNIARVNRWLESVESPRRYHCDEVIKYILDHRKIFAGRVIDTTDMVRKMCADSTKVILCEGQLGIMKDVDLGTYPNVTSSNPHVGGIAGGGGIPASKIARRIGISKAYMTAVGAGPFPTELPELDADGDAMWRIGHEFGATTGRRRRCGWLDLVVLGHAAWANDLTEIALTKIDVLDTFKKIKICTGYQLPSGDEVNIIPASCDEYERVRPIYTEFDGWECDTTMCRTWEELPEKARALIMYIETAVGVPITMISVGPERDAIILRD